MDVNLNLLQITKIIQSQYFVLLKFIHLQNNKQSKMKVVLNFSGKPIILSFGDFEDEINIDELLSINYSNIFGELVTVSALLNRIGILKAESEAIYSNKKLDCDIYEATLAKQYRREANINSGKFTIKDGDTSTSIKLTEESLKSAILLDLAYQNKKKAVIEANKNLAFMDSLYWGIQSKDRKLSVMIKPVVPEDFYDQVIEGSINGILIQKKPIDMP